MARLGGYERGLFQEGEESELPGGNIPTEEKEGAQQGDSVNAQKLSQYIGQAQ